MVNTRNTRTPGQARGFTLIELLVVIVVILLLVGILLPAFGYIMQQAKVSKVSARVQELCNGCDAYKLDAGVFPGQMYPSMLMGIAGSTSVNNSGFTGSQMLALCLFTDQYVASAGQVFPNSKYCNVSVSTITDKSDLYNPTSTTPLYISESVTLSPTTSYTWSGNFSSGAPCTISDRFASRQLPILYCPARLGYPLSNFNQYQYRDNNIYITQPLGSGSFPRAGTVPQGGTDFPGTGNTFQTFITDTRITQPVNPERYLIIAAGIDGLYGTADDIKNW